MANTTDNKVTIEKCGSALGNDTQTHGFGSAVANCKAANDIGEPAVSVDAVQSAPCSSGKSM